MVDLNPKEKINTLKKEIELHNYKYYVKNDPSISDQEYDHLLSRLIELEKSYPQFLTSDSPSQRIGTSILKKNFSVVKHNKRMLSLDNTYSLQQVKSFVERNTESLKKEGLVADKISCEMKIDGVAISLIYEDGVLIRGATRGDGILGEDTTENVKTIKTIPLVIKSNDALINQLLKSVIEVRAEVIMLKKDFDKLNLRRKQKKEKLFANPRNAVGGTLKLQDSSETATRNLAAVAYFLDSDSEILKKVMFHSDRLMMLKKMGFWVDQESIVCSSLNEIEKTLSRWQQFRDDLPFEIDGAVLKFDDVRSWSLLGERSKSPRWAIAYKFSAYSGVTTLKKVSFQVGRTGVITPVAQLEPVLISGSIISNATLYNVNEIKRIGVRIGDKVKVEKGGDVIPKVTDVYTEDRSKNSKGIDIPVICPSCKSKLFTIEDSPHIYCVNSDVCDAQIKARIEHFASKQAMDIKHLGRSTIEELYQKKLIQDSGDLYFLKTIDLYKLDHFKEKSSSNLINSINISKQVSFDRVLFALGISHVGKVTAENLAFTFNDMKSITNANVQDLQKIDGIGETVALSILNFLAKSSTVSVLKKLETAGIKLRMESKDIILKDDKFISGKLFVFSGTLSSLTRDEASKKLLSLGAKVSNSMTRKTDFLVLGNQAGSKYTKAVELQVKIIKENEFLKLIK